MSLDVMIVVNQLINQGFRVIYETKTSVDTMR